MNTPIVDKTCCLEPLTSWNQITIYACKLSLKCFGVAMTQ
jgi:hypothetical protein